MLHSQSVWLQVDHHIYQNVIILLVMYILTLIRSYLFGFTVIILSVCLLQDQIPQGLNMYSLERREEDGL